MISLLSPPSRSCSSALCLPGSWKWPLSTGSLSSSTAGRRTSNYYQFFWKCYPGTGNYTFTALPGGWKVAEEWVSLFSNSFLGITALVTYHDAVRSVEVWELAARVPLSRLVLETDSPYFVLEKLVHRTSKKKSLHGNSSPSMVLEVAEEIASIRGIPMQEVLVATCRNTRDLYSLAC